MKLPQALVTFAVVSLTVACGSSGSSPTQDGGAAAPNEAVQYNLDQINMLRAQNGAGALVLDPALDAFAQAGSVQLSQDHSPHAHFTSSYATCGCNVEAENQGDPNGWTVAPIHTQIDQILSLMMSEGPGGGHHDNIVNPGGALYFTNDFGP